MSAITFILTYKYARGLIYTLSPFFYKDEIMQHGNELYLAMTGEATQCQLFGAWQVRSYR